MTFRKIQKNLDVYWFLDEQMTIIHRDDDLPAIEMSDGSFFWYKNGLIHRENDLPAIIFPNGDQFWFVNGKAHRNEDKPSAIFSSGRKEWHKNGLLHRSAQIFQDGSTGLQLPAIEDPKNAAKYWYKYGLLHRDDDLPAIEVGATKRWFSNGVQHRNFGPAETAPFVEKWFWHGCLLNKDEHPWIIAQKEQELLFEQIPQNYSINTNITPNLPNPTHIIASPQTNTEINTNKSNNFGTANNCPKKSTTNNEINHVYLNKKKSFKL